MKIVYMGTPDFAVNPLHALAEAGYEVAGVITQPDKPKGRGKEIHMSPVKECALQHNIPVYQPVRARRSRFRICAWSPIPISRSAMEKKVCCAQN